MIPYSRQNVTKSDIKAVIKVLESNFLTQGPTGEQLESEFNDYVGSRYCVSVSSATSGLHITCLALGIRNGDRVWTSPNSFISSASAAMMCGAQIDFVDIDIETFNISIPKLKAKLKEAAKDKQLPKAIVVVHHSGSPIDLKAVSEITEPYEIKIIEDASHAIGASFAGKKIGTCLYSDACVFSLHAVKIVTAGEGGIITTRSFKIYQKLKLLRSHGIKRINKTGLTINKREIWNYKVYELGYNYRLTDIQSAMCLSQLTRVDKLNASRCQLAKKYREAFEGGAFLPQKVHTNSISSNHLFCVRVNPYKCKVSRNNIYNAMRVEGYGVNLHYIPIYRHPIFKRLGFKAGYCMNAEKYFRQTITLPLFPDLKYRQQQKIISFIRKVIE